MPRDVRSDDLLKDIALRDCQKTSTHSDEIYAAFKDAMRRLAASVTILTSRDSEGQPHGMVASAVMSLCMEPPSMLVAINRSAGLHPVVSRSGRFCINLLAEHQAHLLAPFSQTAQRAQRFKSDDWHDAWIDDTDRMPWLAAAAASIDCCVETSVDYGTHSVFVGRVRSVRCATDTPQAALPMVWLAGRPAQVREAA